MCCRLRMRLLLACAVSCALACVMSSSASAFILGNPNFDPWLNTATGSRSGNGQPVTLTWSLVADGTSTPDDEGARVGGNLISFLDTLIGGNPVGSNPNDLTARPWFSTLEQSFDRWEALSGINYVYEPNDDGSSLGVASGVLGVRGDIRIGGRNVDGSGGTLAFNYLPNNGDMVIDTSETALFGNTSNDYRYFRNTVAHELGHGLNLEHVTSGTDALLLEPSINTSFDGPQLDEVRAVHFFYGDVHEKSNNGLGNGIASRATDLGSLTPGVTTSIGTDANVPTQFISSTATDFVSVSNIDDSDFFSFSVSQPTQLDAALIPLGGVFSQGAQGQAATTFNANVRSDLVLTIFDTDGTTPLITLDDKFVGGTESLEDFELSEPGEYFARVTGLDDTIQLYQLDLTIDPATFLEADFNEDTNVDNVDLATLESSYGINAGGDTDSDGDTDGTDFLFWQRQFGENVASFGDLRAVPEPTTAVLLLSAMTLVSIPYRRSS